MKDNAIPLPAEVGHNTCMAGITQIGEKRINLDCILRGLFSQF
jgi:hypothetical protein